MAKRRQPCVVCGAVVGPMANSEDMTCSEFCRKKHDANWPTEPGLREGGQEG